MQLNPYGEYAVLLAESLANDWPTSTEGIEERTRDVGMTMPFIALPEHHKKVRRVIDEWLTVVDAPDERSRADLLNRQMAAVSAYPRLTDHDGQGWHLHYRQDVAELPYVMAAVISVGTALHLTTRGMHRLHRCAAGEDEGDTCRNVVVDVTRNGRQRFCSVRCANRAAVRRHRAKVSVSTAQR